MSGYPKVVAWLQAHADLDEAKQRLIETRAAPLEAYTAAAWELIEAGYCSGETLVIDNLVVYLADACSDACPMGPKLEILSVPKPETLAARRALEGES